MIDRNIHLQRILNQIREVVCSQDTNIVFSEYEDVEQLIEDIDKLIHRLAQNDQSVLKI